MSSQVTLDLFAFFCLFFTSNFKKYFFKLSFLFLFFHFILIFIFLSSIFSIHNH